MVWKSGLQEKPDTERNPTLIPSTGEEDGNVHRWDVSSEDTFENHSISDGAVTPRSSTSLRRSSALRRKSTSTRSSFERDSTYYDISGRSSISMSMDEPVPRLSHLSLPTSQWQDDQDSIRRTMSVPSQVRGKNQDVPAPLNIKRRTYSLEDPQRIPSSVEHVGNVNEAWYMDNALLHGLDPNCDQLQIYLLGIPKKQIPPTMDVPASYVVFLPGDRDGASSASNKIARYRCRYPDCEVKWRDEDEHK